MFWYLLKANFSTDKVHEIGEFGLYSGLKVASYTNLGAAVYVAENIHSDYILRWWRVLVEEKV